jgi:hypothetical protein
LKSQIEFVGINPILQGSKDLSTRSDLETPNFEDLQIDSLELEDKPEDL